MREALLRSSIVILRYEKTSSFALYNAPQYRLKRRETRQRAPCRAHGSNHFETRNVAGEGATLMTETTATKQDATGGKPRFSVSQAQELPALMTPAEWSALVGLTQRYVQKCCHNGTIPAVQVGGGRWRVVTRKALTAYGLESL